MKHINDNTIVGYDKNGNGIEAERLQKWAYNQLAIAPNLLRTCNLAAEFYHKSSDKELCTDQELCVYCRAIKRAEGRG